MEERMKYSLGPFAILTFIYFIVGFLTTINGQLQGPLENVFFSEAYNLKNTLSTLVSFFFFLGYLLNGRLGGKLINSCGYKATLLRALCIMIAGLCMYSLSSWFVYNYGYLSFCIMEDTVSYGYFIFLLGAYLMGTSAALLQVVINPYVAAYELPNTQPVQRMNIVCAINSFGTTIAPFFVTEVIFSGVALNNISPEQLMLPFLLIALCVIIVTLVTSRLNLPDLCNTHTEEGENLEKSVWAFSHLKLGVIAIFFYVGAEVSVGVNVNLHAIELIEAGYPLYIFGKEHIVLWGLDLGIPALLATLYWGGLMIGRLIFSFFNNISPKRLLIVTTVIAVLLMIISIIMNNLWILVSVGLCHSVMWGCIFTLAIKGLKKYTSKASGVFMMGVFGGAIFPVVQGGLADAIGSWRFTWIIPIVCELVMFYYALYGSRIKDKECL